MLLVKMALRNVLRQRRRSFLTLLSMAVGYALLSITLSVAEGSYNLIIEKFTSNITGHVQVHRQGYLERPSLYKTISQPQDLLQQLQQQAPGSLGTMRIKGGALAYGQNRVVPIALIGIDPKGEDAVTQISSKVVVGHFIDDGVPLDEVLLGAKIADVLKLSVGDDLVLISSGADGSIANGVYRIRGIVGQKDSYLGNLAILSLKGAREFFSMGIEAHEIILRLHHFKEARSLAKILKTNLNPPDLSIDPWQEVEKEFYQSMEADKQGNHISIFIIVIMVGIGVLNTVLMAVLERMREYGLLRAIGARPGSILGLVLLESSWLSGFGIALGLALCLPINYWFQEYGIIMDHPIEIGGMAFDRILGEISYYSMFFPGIIIFLTAVLVSLFPAIKAASASPIQVINSI